MSALLQSGPSARLPGWASALTGHSMPGGLIDLDVLIEKANELRPLPASTLRLAALIGNPHCDLQEIENVVAFDQALTLKWLRVANSAFAGGSAGITTVREALLRLGTAQVLSLATISHVSPLLQKEVAEYGLREGDLWRHSVAAAVAAETAPAFCGVPVPPESFTAALLHDIGKLLMGRFLSPEILHLLRQAEHCGGLNRLQAETEILQVHHGEVGGVIARHWQLPETIVKGIVYHHTPEQGFSRICDVVHLANIAAKKIEAALGSIPSDAALNPDAAERLDIASERFLKLCDTAVSRYEQVRGLYAVGIMKLQGSAT